MENEKLLECIDADLIDLVKAIHDMGIHKPLFMKLLTAPDYGETIINVKNISTMSLCEIPPTDDEVDDDDEEPELGTLITMTNGEEILTFSKIDDITSRIENFGEGVII